MNSPVDEWTEKADGDFRVAEYEFARLDRPVYDAVCYHCQQCIEKLMKAVLVKNAQTPPFTHDLLTLADCMRLVAVDSTCDVDDLRFLSLAAAHYRYPGDSADRSHAERAILLCRRLRTSLLVLLEQP